VRRPDIRPGSVYVRNLFDALCSTVGVPIEDVMLALVSMSGAMPFDPDVWSWDPDEGFYRAMFEDGSELNLAWEPGAGWLVQHPRTPTAWFHVYEDVEDPRQRPDQVFSAMYEVRSKYGRKSGNTALRHYGAQNP